MRYLQQLLMGAMLLANQVSAALPHVATASAEAQAKTDVKVEQIVQLNSAKASALEVASVKVPNFDTEVLAPLRAAQEAKAKAEAAKLAAARAAQKASSAPSVARPGATGALNDAQIAYLGNCESGMTATRNSGNSFYGAFQFTIPTWNAMATGYDRADHAPLEVQVAAVQKLLSRSSIYTQFPGCARQMQARGLI